ncbi:MAG: DNA recombination protein RmuC [Oceanospirillaceae bacterium]|nr:DNA recombination protein RmuC [Oceanospirillaceae bacterium]
MLFSQIDMQSAVLGAIVAMAIGLLLLLWSSLINAKQRQQLLFKLQLQQDREQNINQQLDTQRQQNQKLQQRSISVEQLLHQEQVINAQLNEKISVFELSEQEKLKIQAELIEYRDLLVAANNQITQLEVRLLSERKINEEKSQIFNQARDQLKQDFSLLANQIFEDKTSRFKQDSQESISQILNPLREQLGDFKRKVEDVYDKETRDRQALYQQIDHLKQLNQQMSQDTINLTQALKGNSKVQGNWGEVILERVLEDSGLRKGHEYEIQVSLTAEGKRYQPDVIVRLPDEKDMIIDAKVSLTGYERYCSGAGDPGREEFLIEHVQSIRNHIRGLSQKAYEKLEGIRTLDFVLMFIPVEGAFMLALEHDQGLFRYAFQRNIIMVSPTTLLVTLRTVQNIWRFEQQNQNAQVIAKRGAELYDKFVNFVESMDDLGKHLDRAQSAYDESYKRLSTGKGNLVKQAVALSKLGVNGKKQLPSSLTHSIDVGPESSQ